jgi:DNA primase
MTYINFKALKARVPITAILEHYKLLAELTPSKDGYEGTCPFCGSNSFKVHTEKNVWHCFGECKKQRGKNGGNILDFVMRKEKGSITTVARRIDSWFHVKTKATNHQHVTEDPDTDDAESIVGEGRARALPESETSHTDDSVGPISSDAKNTPLEYELKHLDSEHSFLTDTLGLHPDTVEHFGVGYFTRRGVMHNRIAVPIYNSDGVLVAYAGINPEDRTYKYPKQFNPALELYNLNPACTSVHLTNRPFVFICQRFEDVWYVYEQGYDNAVTLLGDKMTPRQGELFRTAFPKLHRLDLVIPTDAPAIASVVRELGYAARTLHFICPESVRPDDT